MSAPRLVQIGTYMKVDPGKPKSKTANASEKPEPKAPPTYKYVGCLTVKNPEKQFIRPGPPGSSTALHHVEEMTVQKCFDWCHEQRMLVGESAQFFVLKS